MVIVDLSVSAIDSIGAALLIRRHKPVRRYGSEKSIECARSGVAVIDEIIKSILLVFNAGIRPSNGIFSMRISRPRYFPRARAISTLIPEGWPPGSTISNGG